MSFLDFLDGLVATLDRHQLSFRLALHPLYGPSRVQGKVRQTPPVSGNCYCTVVIANAYTIKQPWAPPATTVLTTCTPPKLGGEAVSSRYLVSDATTCRSQMKEKDRTRMQLVAQ